MTGGGCLRVILGDQCSGSLSALDDIDKARDTILMMEVQEECTYVPHHAQKIVLVLSAMRHFAATLEAKGARLRYVRLDDPDNTGTLSGEVARAVEALRPAKVVATEPGEWRVRQAMESWAAACGVPVEIRGDDRFLCPTGRFAGWARGRKQLRMEQFYRMMRERTGLLMEDGKPAGGAWNYDAQNRRALGRDVTVPPPRRFPPDAITQEVITLVAERFGSHFGAAEDFDWPVTRSEALAALREFIADRLPQFGDYQDAMASDEATLFHALISTSLNCGLLLPGECCAAAEAAWRAGLAPLNAVEGFVRQILGWREYVRGLYWLKMPGYAQDNALQAERALPEFYWTGATDMACLRAAITQTRDRAYAHHIQRLMVTGNFALLAGLAPAEVNAWYLIVYADAYEWVELPNTHGMALFADGGVIASKPYAASGSYIDRMSDYCRGCAYDVTLRHGERACPFNYLYWDFVARHAETFATLPRMAMPLANLRRMPAARLQAMRDQAATFLASEAMRGYT